MPGGILGHPVPGGYKYGDLALQVGGVSNLRQSNMELRPKNDCAGEDQQQLYTADPFSRQRERPTSTTRNCLTIIKIWS
jgi:hypothetical protein